jgi:cytochrome P450
MSATADRDDMLRGDLYEQLRPLEGAGPVVNVGASGVDGSPAVLVMGYDEAAHVLHDWRTFSSSVHARQDEFRGITIRQMDGAEHRIHRALVSQAFRPSMVARWEHEAALPIIETLLDDVAASGKADLVAAIASQYPIRVICSILGIAPKDHAQFLRWSEGIVQGMFDPEAGHDAKDGLGDWLQPQVELRRREPCGDLLSELVTAEVEGRRLDDDHLYGFLRLLIPAGAETTFRAMGNTLLALLSNPVELERARREPESIPGIIEETLRWDTSIPMTVRIATEATELGGCPIPKGAAVQTVLGLADRDTRRWSDPEVWNPRREPLPNLAFGFGAHQCLGIHLARMELRVGIQHVLERFPNLRLDPDEPAPRIEGIAFRGPASLPVRFDPA